MRRFVNQWGIYVVDFGQNKGSVQSGKRLAVIMQNCIGNQFSPTTICIPLTTQNKKPLPTHYYIQKKDYPCIESDSVLLCEQVTTIDVQSQVGQYIGMIRDKDKKEIYYRFLNNFIL